MPEDTKPAAQDSGWTEIACECGSRFITGYRGGKGTVRCKPCRVIAQRRSTRDSARRKILRDNPDAEFVDERSVVAAKRCVDCDSPVERSTKGRVRKRCAPCCKAEIKRLNRQRYERIRALQLANPAPRKPRINACLGCGCDVESKPTGRVRYRCEPCRIAHRNDLMEAWRAANPATVRLMNKRRNQRKRAAQKGVDAESYDAHQIFERDRWRCHLCRKGIRRDLKFPHPRSASVDHLVPIAEGGADSPANVAAAHLQCNQRKGSRGGGEQLMLVG
jgi:5-methylcytosine-specific restriction endonuclease McrA